MSHQYSENQTQGIIFPYKTLPTKGWLVFSLQKVVSWKSKGNILKLFLVNNTIVLGLKIWKQYSFFSLPFFIQTKVRESKKFCREFSYEEMLIWANILSKIWISVCKKSVRKVFWLFTKHSNVSSKVWVIANDTGNPKKYFPFNISHCKSKRVGVLCEDVVCVIDLKSLL